MASVVWDSVEGIGVTPWDEICGPLDYFTEIAIPETVEIPCQKPDMEDLLSVMVNAEILSTRLIKTPVSTSYEGQILSGFKLIIELKLKQKIKYVADEPTQSVHAAHFEKTISSIFVILPEEINGCDTERLFKNKKLIVTPYVEDIYAAKMDCRKIFKNIVVLVQVTPPANDC